MRLYYILFNVVAAGGLFLLNGLLGKLQYGMTGKLFEYGKFTFESGEDHNFSGNFFQKIVNPAVYLAALAAFGQRLGMLELVESMWLLVPMFWGYRLLYMVIKNVFVFLNVKYEAFALVLSILLSEGVFFCIVKPLLEQGESIWIPSTALRDALWYAILAYIVKIAWDIMREKFSGSNLYPEEQRRNLVWKQYDKFNGKFGNYIVGEVSRKYGEKLCATDCSQLICTLYAIMIYEDYNRPCLVRMAERVAKATFWRQHTMTMGIMQVKTDQNITDYESIQRALEKISAPFLNGDSCPSYTAIGQYNKGQDYESEVWAIYRILEELIPYDSSISEDNESYKI